MKVGKVLSVIVVSLIVIVAVVGVVAEFGMRAYLGKQITSSLGSTEAPATVSFGSSPLLLGLVKRELSLVEITAPNTLSITENSQGVPQIAGQPETHIVARGLRIDDTSASTARSLEVDTILPDEFILAQLQQGMAQAQAQQQTTPTGDSDVEIADLAAGLLQEIIDVSGVTTHPAENTFDVEFNNKAAVITLQPVNEPGASSHFEALNTSLFGFDLPEQVSETITTSLNDGVADFGGTDLTLTEMSVTDGGLSMRLEGTDVPLDSLQTLN